MQPPFERRYIIEKGTTDDFPPTAEGLEQWEANTVKLAAEQKAKKLAELKAKAEQPAIPVERQTRPLTKMEAFRYLELEEQRGKPYSRPEMAVTTRMDSGKLLFLPVPNDDRRYIFDKRSFPVRHWLAISPR